jgi:hypothetical protein
VRDGSAAGVAFSNTSDQIASWYIIYSCPVFVYPSHNIQRFPPAEEVPTVEVLFRYEFINSNRFCKYFGLEQ